MTIKMALIEAIDKLKSNNIKEAFLKAKILLSFTLNKEKEFFITHDNYELTNKEMKKYSDLINRIINNEPIQYITGKQEFMGLEFSVNSDVLIPRPDTEILVEEVIKIAKENEINTILDMCTGSGAIAVSLKRYINDCEVFASDISSNALKTANQNAINNKTYVKFIKSDLFENIKNKMNMIVSNPPYIETDTIKVLDKEVQNEPLIALDGGKDGLDFYRKIINNAYNFLTNEGFLCLEIGYNQKEAVTEIINETKKYKELYSKKDLGGNDRIVVCRRK